MKLDKREEYRWDLLEISACTTLMGRSLILGTSLLCLQGQSVHPLWKCCLICLQSHTTHLSSSVPSLVANMPLLPRLAVWSCFGPHLLLPFWQIPSQHNAKILLLISSSSWGSCTEILPGIVRASSRDVSEIMKQLCLQSAGDTFFFCLSCLLLTSHLVLKKQELWEFALDNGTEK